MTATTVYPDLRPGSPPPFFPNTEAKARARRSVGEALGLAQANLDSGLSANPTDLAGSVARYQNELRLIEDTPVG